MSSSPDQLRTTLWELVTGPVAVASAAATLLAGLLGVFDPLWQLLVATSGMWFPITASLSAVAPLIEAIPTGLVTQVFIVATFVYVAILLDRLAERVVAWIRRQS